MLKLFAISTAALFLSAGSVAIHPDPHDAMQHALVARIRTTVSSPPPLASSNDSRRAGLLLAILYAAKASSITGR
jgi:hypothetical protein